MICHRQRFRVLGKGKQMESSSTKFIKELLVLAHFENGDVRQVIVPNKRMDDFKDLVFAFLTQDKPCVTCSADTLALDIVPFKMESA